MHHPSLRGAGAVLLLIGAGIPAAVLVSAQLFDTTAAIGVLIVLVVVAAAALMRVVRRSEH